MQPGEAIFLLNYEDICFVMKDWPRPGTSTSPQYQSPDPVSVPVSVAVTVTVPFLVRHSTRRSLSHCVILARRATAGVAPVFFFISLLSRCCFSSVPCYGFVALLFLGQKRMKDDGGGVRFQFGAAGRSSSSSSSRESSTLPSSGAYQMHWLRCK